ncbi:endonuclease YncB(thermonuclease family) [Pelomonas aquatica]|uniref:Endonuclease YncB(Thermonuclease family) n=1 Tax=Pelomonas aquatica TaxID=431058 RepID=A0ABU1ZGB4_9BURK|nr:thermonuclease family protein [Pelomonas aquatica]MDR7299667.1 endonuclease YncB(thermonuclease family) [Pelomonas aquatica]
MFELAVRTALAYALGLGLAASAWADGALRGQVIRVVGGDVITLVDALHREHRLRLAFVDAPEIGQPFGDEAQSALAAMVLGREVTATLRGDDEDGTALAEVIEPRGHLVNVELVRRGLAWHDYFGVQIKQERDQYQAAMADAQQARLGMWALDRVEAPRDYRARAGQYLRWWLFGVAGLAGFTLLGLIFAIYDKQIAAWIARQDALTKLSAEANRTARIRSEAEAAERDRTRDIANREMDRLAAIRSGSAHREQDHV